MENPFWLLKMPDIPVKGADHIGCEALINKRPGHDIEEQDRRQEGLQPPNQDEDA